MSWVRPSAGNARPRVLSFEVEVADTLRQQRG